ncbi:FKBP-type peptidyl-prolyl cis-trans isomerase [Motiliproteus coralliicola]|uniref:Peptidyl-prolyl cis-trans isomerase n=1 Tax=Motiliproteus coralliicola TaxID=2283196 RepID=A0A369WBG5_9GAMM|nr:FKBP-type peptidyl-prolyl cis-trans isomerase [Motiliproteus coralliicola]RDE18997.1 FKBP-type peptidyl-prolyl cis-trans isomerase [Motiliproteus coralliicola]
MKKTMLAAALATTMFALPQAQAAGLESDESKVSYIMGLDVGTRMEGLGYELDQEAFLKGLQEFALKGEQRSISNEALQQAMQQAQARFQQRQQEQQAKQAEANLQAGQAYLAENAKKEGVVTTESGLQYKIIEAGEGAKPMATDTVQVHYKGTLIDGTEFDSSYSHGGPATFPLNGVIPGWTEGLQLLAKGGKAELYIPAKLAYGPIGMGQVIGPNSTLVFEVELLDINPSAEAKPEAAAAQ